MNSSHLSLEYAVEDCRNEILTLTRVGRNYYTSNRRAELEISMEICSFLVEHALSWSQEFSEYATLQTPTNDYELELEMKESERRKELLTGN